MPKRRVASFTYWSGEDELEDVRFIPADVLGFEAPVKLPGISYVTPGTSNPVVQVGLVKGRPKNIVFGLHSRLGNRPAEDWKPVTRIIRVLVDRDPHVCDWRCQGAFPKGDCACECKGRNHGRSFRCDLAT
jgi:hypothetical protein